MTWAFFALGTDIVLFKLLVLRTYNVWLRLCALGRDNVWL